MKNEAMKNTTRPADSALAKIHGDMAVRSVSRRRWRESMFLKCTCAAIVRDIGRHGVDARWIVVMVPQGRLRDQIYGVALEQLHHPHAEHHNLSVFQGLKRKWQACSVWTYQQHSTMSSMQDCCISWGMRKIMDSPAYQGGWIAFWRNVKLLWRYHRRTHESRTPHFSGNSERFTLVSSNEDEDGNHALWLCVIITDLQSIVCTQTSHDNARLPRSFRSERVLDR